MTSLVFYIESPIIVIMSKKLFRVNAVIFDMDGVITDTMPYHYRAWLRVFQEEGISVTHFDIYCREGQKGIVSVAEIFKKYGKLFSQSRAREILEKKEKLFQKIVRHRFISGARSYIRSLNRTGFRLALVTGTSRPEVERILPKQIYGLFVVTITGNDVRYGKPDPEPYRKAVQHLKISPHETVVIENAPFGIQSAKSAGLRCFALETSLPRKFLKGADQIFASYRQLTQSIEFVPLKSVHKDKP